MIQVYNNFLPKDVFKKLKNAMMSNYFPWYFNEYVNYKGEKNDSFQFTFMFMKKGLYECWGEWKDIIEPVIKNIKHSKMNRIKANLLTRTNKIIEQGYHKENKGIQNFLKFKISIFPKSIHIIDIIN